MAPLLVLRDGRVWDGVSAEARPADVVCEDGLVREVVEPGAARAGAEDISVDLAGGTVLPGLVDSHVHLVWDGSTDPVAHVARDGEQLTAVRAAEHARAYLPAGITAVRDLGGDWDVAITLAAAVDRGHLDGPAIVAAGQTVIMTGGHDPFWGIPCDGPDAVVRGVRGQVAKGAGVIKTAATGGVYGRSDGEEVGASELTYEELAALAGEAHRRGRRVAAHALGEDGVRNAVRAGIDTVEHGVFLAEDVVEDMVRRGTVLCPTAEVYRRMADGGAPGYAVRKARDVVEAHRRSVALAIEAGVPVIAGTDAGAPGMAHPSLVDEITTLRDYGLSPLQALKAATSSAADALGIPGAGRVRPGSPADLVLVDGDPFSDPGLLRNPWGVVRRQSLRWN
ncbi:metal-dependent hydrolase family protein [Streptomonospora wellingtoniae]|uniref:Amidohydrolase family protein n=1 Tax=Streptomonospora wellingtoniae TaxID=3075544 RepID=A0ABU2KZH5_9ACTN|nr:amidohydrolase family protein [Streptomonospora sp. DSM 45055]MDT0304483.1 amidohydrolase family protein [Streptomonospora sp. DSM 45055]